MKNVKKAAAVFCGMAVAILFAAHTLSAFAYESVELADRMDQLTAGTPGILADEVYAEAGETVEFSVMIGNNIGYTNIGISLFYDKNLELILNDRDKPDVTFGAASEDLVRVVTLNRDRCIIGYTSMGDNEVYEDGVMFTAKFTVPADAEVGTVYPMTLYVENLSDSLTIPQEFTVVDGWIEVYIPETTTSATTTSATTSRATSTTTSATTTTVTTATDTTKQTDITTEETSTDETTSKDVTQDTSAIGTTTATTPETDSSTLKTTKKTEHDPTRELTTSAKGGNSGTSTTKSSVTRTTTKTDSAKTDDVGTGAAVAAGMLAGVTAMLFRKRKH